MSIILSIASTQWVCRHWNQGKDYFIAKLHKIMGDIFFVVVFFFVFFNVVVFVFGIIISSSSIIKIQLMAQKEWKSPTTQKKSKTQKFLPPPKRFIVLHIWNRLFHQKYPFRKSEYFFLGGGHRGKRTHEHYDLKTQPAKRPDDWKGKESTLEPSCSSFHLVSLSNKMKCLRKLINLYCVRNEEEEKMPPYVWTQPSLAAFMRSDG